MGSLALLGAISFLASLLLTPVSRNLFRRAGILDAGNSARKLQTTPVPRAGGPAIALSYVIAFAVLLLIDNLVTAALREQLPNIWKVLPAAILIFGTGLLDDIYSLSPKAKLLGQTTAALLAVLGGIQIHQIFGFELNQVVSSVVTIVWLVGCSNAFNLIDGVDGLAGSVGFFASLTMLIAALMYRDFTLAIATVPLVGALLGFLRYNFFPASIYLGDSGSLLIGFLIGNFSIVWSQKAVTALGVLAPFMVLCFPLGDMTFSIVRRYQSGRPIFEADRGHVHHRLLARGLSPQRVTDVLCWVCAAAAVFSLLQSVVPVYQGLIFILFCAALLFVVHRMGYADLRISETLEKVRGMLGPRRAEAALAEASKAVDASCEDGDFLSALQDCSAKLGIQLLKVRWHGSELVGKKPETPGSAIRIALPAEDEVQVWYPRGNPQVSAIEQFSELLRRWHRETAPRQQTGLAKSAGDSA